MSELFRRALERWVSFTKPEPSGLEHLFTVDERRRPGQVGRQRTVSAQITDVVAYLEAEGWREDRGRLQCYALWLLEMRDRYEGVTVS